MPIWRDPLDELIDDLGRAVPASPTPAQDIPPMEDYCVFGRYMLARDPAERLRLAEDPAVQRVQAFHDRLARARPSTGPVEPTG
jgi:hypothetical protein